MNFDDVYDFITVLNEEKIAYGLGGSSMLYFHQLVLEPRDLDVVVAVSDFQHLVDVFEKLGTVIYEEDSGDYRTEKFATIKFKSIEVDVMAGFKVEHDKGVFEFIFDPKKLHKGKLKDLTVYLTKLEDWLVAYSVFNDPKNRVPLIREALIRQGKWDKERLNLYKKGNIPKRVEDLIDEML